MDTKVSVLMGDGLNHVRNVDALVIPADNMLNIKVSKIGKEVNKIDGGNLSTRLNDLRRNFTMNTGSITYPDTSCIAIEPDKFPAKYLFISVVPLVSKSDSRDVKVEGLYKAYVNILTLAIKHKCKNILLPVLGVENKEYDVSILMYALLSALTDFVKATSFIKEICIITRNKSEKEMVLKWFDSVSRSFGLEAWCVRNSFDMNENNLKSIAFMLF